MGHSAMYKFFIETYGCQMNAYDSNIIAALMTMAGFERTYESSDADILIFYTCNVREKAAKKVFSNIGLLRSEKTKVIAVGGCVPQAEKNMIFKCKHIDIAFGPSAYRKLPAYVSKILNDEEDRILDVELTQSSKFDCCNAERTVSRSEFVTIQEGCDNYCSYCVVPYTRGKEYSRPAADIISEVKMLLAKGAQEITLLGQNVNSYNGDAPYISIGKPRGSWNFERLLQEVAESDGLKRLRYTTSHPKDVTVGLMKKHAQIDILAPFAHIPAQSGSDRILKLMNRRYVAQEYIDKLNMFRDICPAIQFSSDFIVGFPTETADDFEDTLKLVREVGYLSSYSFKYSPRSDTPAATMSGQIHDTIKAKRLDILQRELMRSQTLHNESIVGKTMETLFDKPGKKSMQYVGKNVYMQSVIVESDIDLTGKFGMVLIEKAFKNSVFGRLV
ncbi:MAG: tRNA (N6-isopentenyl adenosine(37)-C2)-methylthiotransferase MiaB [Holosporales bacterium]|jgi:tRNA-2-methylthio-N6-dimethylallyladenosine synthase|nr:tRNA (N6-isopentenyl adenosine(37)-C2)-methylthiotransferase MiaB [Holosporales bacterium]